MYKICKICSHERYFVLVFKLINIYSNKQTKNCVRGIFYHSVGNVTRKIPALKSPQHQCAEAVWRARREPLVLLSRSKLAKCTAGRSVGKAAVRLIMARCHTMHVAPIRPIITGCSSRAIGTESARCEPNYMQHSHSLFHIIQREIPLRWRKKRKNWSALSHTNSRIYSIFIFSKINVFFSVDAVTNASEQERN